MLARSFIISLLTATTALASSPVDDGQDSQKVIPPPTEKLRKPLACPTPVDFAGVECPYLECGTWCEIKATTVCQFMKRPIDDVFSLLSGVFGFDFPVNVRLCPVGRCSKDAKCLCREDLVRRLSVLLLGDQQVDNHQKHFADEL